MSIDNGISIVVEERDGSLCLRVALVTILSHLYIIEGQNWEFFFVEGQNREIKIMGKIKKNGRRAKLKKKRWAKSENKNGGHELGKQNGRGAKSKNKMVGKIEKQNGRGTKSEKKSGQNEKKKLSRGAEVNLR